MQQRAFDQEKFVNAILFFAKHANPKQLGSTKLNKLLYHSDFLHFKRYGRPIIGDRYVKMPYGPVPSTAYAIIVGASAKLAERPSKTNVLTGRVRVREVKITDDKKLQKIEALVEPDLAVFSESELEVLQEIATEYKNRTGTRLSKDSHEPDQPWSQTDYLQVIRYELVLDESKDSLPNSYITHWKNERRDLLEVLAA